MKLFDLFSAPDDSPQPDGSGRGAPRRHARDGFPLRLRRRPAPREDPPARPSSDLPTDDTDRLPRVVLPTGAGQGGPTSPRPSPAALPAPEAAAADGVPAPEPDPAQAGGTTGLASGASGWAETDDENTGPPSGAGHPTAAAASTGLLPDEEPGGRRPGAMMKGWLVIVVALGCVLGAAALPPGIRCSDPTLLLPASFMLLAALPAILGLYYVDTLRSVRLTHSRWAAATGALRTFVVTWSFCLPVVVAALVFAVMQTPLPDQSPLLATGVAVLGVGALARLIGDGSADLHREVPRHAPFGRWLGRFWRTHPWVLVYLVLAAAIAVWASFSSLAC